MRIYLFQTMILAIIEEKIRTYVALDNNHGVIRFLYKLCSASLYVNTGFIKPSKWYGAPRARRLKKVELRKKVFFPKPNIYIGKKNMFCEI